MLNIYEYVADPRLWTRGYLPEGLGDNTSGEALRVESIGTTELGAADWTQYPAADSNLRQPLTVFRRSGLHEPNSHSEVP
jgi:hypothetical protein